MENLNHVCGTNGSQIASAAGVNSGAPSATPSNHRTLGDAHRCWLRRYDGDLGAVVYGSVRASDEDELSLLVDVPELAESGETSLPAGEASAMMAAVVPQGEDVASGANDTRERMRCRGHSLSIDGDVSVWPGMVVAGNEHEPAPFVVKKFMSVQELEELALTDPQPAWRIHTNWQSAANSKEREMRYMEELERKLHTLEIHASTFSAQFSMFESDAEGLSMKNKELKLQLQSMKEHVHLHDALNNALREEVRRLKIMTGQLPAPETIPNAGEMMNFEASSGGGNQQYYHSLSF